MSFKSVISKTHSPLTFTRVQERGWFSAPLGESLSVKRHTMTMLQFLWAPLHLRSQNTPGPGRERWRVGDRGAQLSSVTAEVALGFCKSKV